VDGGVSQNDFILQAIADYTGIHTSRPADIEKTSLGAAFLAGLHIGFWKNLSEIKNLLLPDRIFIPKIPGEIRRGKLDRFNMAVERSKDWRQHQVPRNRPLKKIVNWSTVISFLVGMCFCYVLMNYQY